MLRLRYPSKNFKRQWRDAIAQGVDFCIDAHIGRFKRKGIQGFIDFMCHDGPYRVSDFGAFFCGSLHVGLVRLISTQQYEIEYSETETGTIIKVHRKTPERGAVEADS